jgi:hypothetical protein
MGAVDVRGQSGEFVVRRIGDKALNSQVITLIRLDLFNYPEDAGVAL